MSKSKTFHRVFTIQVKGRGTNNVNADIISETIDSVIDAFESQNASLKVEKSTYIYDDPGVARPMVVTKVWPARPPKIKPEKEIDNNELPG